MNGKSVLGALLVVVGGLMVMNFVGISLGWIIGILMPFIFIGLGVVGLKNNSKVIGGVLLALGAFMLIGKLAGIIALLLAIGLIFWGASMFKHQRRV